jgi:hypothetical protein
VLSAPQVGDELEKVQRVVVDQIAEVRGRYRRRRTVGEREHRVVARRRCHGEERRRVRRVGDFEEVAGDRRGVVADAEPAPSGSEPDLPARRATVRVRLLERDGRAT